MTMKSSRDAQPVIVTVSTPEDGPPPGLEPIADQARIVHTTDAEALRGAIGEADILMVTDFRTTIVRDAWAGAAKVQWVHATSAGVDAILFPELVDSDVPVTNARGIFDRPIAEYVLGLILAYAKDLPHTLDLQRAHHWKHRDTERIEGRQVLVVGAGSIGRAIARMLNAAGMQVTGVARHAREQDADFRAVHAVESLPGLLAEADYVVVATPLTPQTRGLFDREAFGCMKPSARFINIGRGPIVKTADLLEALRAEAIAGAALDVFEQEPLPADHPLWDTPGVIVSAHMAGDFLGWREALSAQFIDNFQRWRRGEPLQNIVDKRRGYVPVKE